MRIKTAILIMTAMTLSSCASQTYLINGGGYEPTDKEMQMFFVSGVGQQQVVNAAEICGGAEKVAKIQTKQSFLNGFLGSLTQGIYTPRDIAVYCK